jgi:transcriptional regulator with XRE-family HTH domain
MNASSGVARFSCIYYNGFMYTTVDEAEARLARSVRQEREARGWSLADLAERSGVSRASISKIERGEASPTAVILVRLAGAFDLTFAGLLARAEGGTERLSRAAQQLLWRDPATSYLRRQIFERADHPVELVSVELPAAARIGFPASSYRRFRQLIWLNHGKLAITEGGVRHELEPGDCFAFGAPADVTLANETDAACRYLVVVVRG